MSQIMKGFFNKGDRSEVRGTRSHPSRDEELLSFQDLDDQNPDSMDHTPSAPVDKKVLSLEL